ncbi:hypothetical protein DWB64_15925 [Fusibacter sp. A1]|nr:hypothetical protein DWB64_15925 [Fusibacter sp. A1]
MGSRNKLITGVLFIIASIIMGLVSWIGFTYASNKLAAIFSCSSSLISLCFGVLLLVQSNGVKHN